jgi:hypothetical protein
MIVDSDTSPKFRGWHPEIKTRKLMYEGFLVRNVP